MMSSQGYVFRLPGFGTTVLGHQPGILLLFFHPFSLVYLVFFLLRISPLSSSLQPVLLSIYLRVRHPCV